MKLGSSLMHGGRQIGEEMSAFDSLGRMFPLATICPSVAA
jgi:hypothetical protein